MRGYGTYHHNRRHHEKLSKGWILWVASRSRAARRAAKKRERQLARTLIIRELRGTL